MHIKLRASNGISNKFDTNTDTTFILHDVIENRENSVQAFPRGINQKLQYSASDGIRYRYIGSVFRPDNRDVTSHLQSDQEMERKRYREIEGEEQLIDKQVD